MGIIARLFMTFFGSWLGTMVYVAMFGEIIVNKNAFEEWLIVMAAAVVVQIVMYIRKKLWYNEPYER